MLRPALIALSLFAPSSVAFISNAKNTNTAFAKDVSIQIDAPDVLAAKVVPTVLLPAQKQESEQDEGIPDIEQMSMAELNALTLTLPSVDADGEFVLPERATLEEARDMVWDHIVQAPWSKSQTPCCAEYPFCGCPKL